MHTLITNQMRNSQSNASQTSQDFFFLKNRPDSYSSGQIQLQANDKTYDLKIVQVHTNSLPASQKPYLPASRDSFKV